MTNWLNIYDHFASYLTQTGTNNFSFIFQNFISFFFVVNNEWNNAYKFLKEEITVSFTKQKQFKNQNNKMSFLNQINTIKIKKFN